MSALSEPGDTPSPAAPYYAVVGSCLVVLVGLTIPIFAPQPFVRTYNHVESGAFRLALFAAAPWAAALILLLLPPLRQLGLALAGTVSIIVLVPLVPYLGLATLFAGFMLDNHDQWLSYFSTMAAAVMLFITAVMSIRGGRAIPESARQEWVWPAAFMVCIVYAAAAAANVDVERKQTRQGMDTIRANDLAAQRNVETIVKCAASYAQEHAATGFPASLRDLATGTMPCVPPAVAAGQADGYKYHYFPSLPDAAGRVRLYDACAEPDRYMETGTTTIVVDETGRSPMLVGGDRERRIGVSCRDAWYGQTLRAIRFCAARYAAAHPERGYPSAFRDIGARGDQCLVKEDRPKSFYENTFYFDGDAYTYVAAVPESNGRVTSYEVHVSHRGWRQLLDERGGIHRTRSDRLATVRDPADLPEPPRTPYRKPRIDVPKDGATLLKLCAESEAEECLARTRMLEGRGDIDGARAGYERLCDDYVGDACIWLARKVAGTQDQLEQLLGRGCDSGSAEACRTLGWQIAGSDPLRSRRFLIKGCGAAKDTQDECREYR